MRLRSICARTSRRLWRVSEYRMKDYTGEIVSNKQIAPDAFEMTVGVKDMPEVRPGQFAMLEVPRKDCVLRRPFGILSRDENSVSFLYRVKGNGTIALSELEAGDGIRLTMPLGNGFPTEKRSKVAIVGGGFGIVPLYLLAKEYRGAEVRIYNGFVNASAVMLEREFGKCGKFTLCTDDGSRGFHGYPVAALEKDMDEGFAPEVIFCCGPTPLMKSVKALAARRGVKAYLSLEQRMGCGVGACLTCTCKVAGHNKRVCKDGPVFDSAEVFE